MTHFFIKVFLHKFLFEIKDNFEWKRQIMKKSKVKNNDMIEIELATTQLYFSGIILHGYCMDLIKEWFETSRGNVTSLQPTSVPIPRKILFFGHVGELEKALGIKDSLSAKNKQAVRTNPRGVKEIAYNRLDINQYEDEKLYKFDFVKNLKGFSGLIKMVQQTSAYQTVIKDKILDITDMIY